MTTAVAVEVEEPPDWAVCARLLWGRDPRPEPTEAEARVVVWLLLDQGHTMTDIARHTGVERLHVERVAAKWRLANSPDREPYTSNAARRQRIARQWAPSAELRDRLRGEVVILPAVTAARR